jgi:two-component sensor histidine kinase
MFNTAQFRKSDECGVRIDGSIPLGVNEFFLLREMNHRLANTLAVLTSMLRRDFSLSASPILQEALARFETRIVAFSDLHRSLMIGAADDRISAQYYVENLCKALSKALLEPLGVRCEVSADTGDLSGERCELLGLVIAELVINATKHAFGEGTEGRIRVDLARKVDSWLCVVSDNGNGSKAGTPGVGSKIVNQLVRALGGGFSTKSGRNGTTVMVIFPN